MKVNPGEIHDILYQKPVVFFADDQWFESFQNRYDIPYPSLTEVLTIINRLYKLMEYNSECMLPMNAKMRMSTKLPGGRRPNPLSAARRHSGLKIGPFVVEPSTANMDLPELDGNDHEVHIFLA